MFTWISEPGEIPLWFQFLFNIQTWQEQDFKHWSSLGSEDYLRLSHSSQLDSSLVKLDLDEVLHRSLYSKRLLEQKEYDFQQLPTTIPGALEVTYADLPSTSSFVGLTPFLARMDETFSTSPLSAAFINLSSYLFQSGFSWETESEKWAYGALWSHQGLSHNANGTQQNPPCLQTLLYPSDLWSYLCNIPVTRLLVLNVQSSGTAWLSHFGPKGDL